MAAIEPESAQAENAKLEWLRAVAREGFEAIGQGDYTELVSDNEVCAFMRQIRDEVGTELAAHGALASSPQGDRQSLC